MGYWWLFAALLLLCGATLSYSAGLRRGPQRFRARGIIPLLVGGAFPLLIYGVVALLVQNRDPAAYLAEFSRGVVWVLGVALLPVSALWLGTILGKVPHVFRG